MILIGFADENSKVLLELMRFSGREVNLIELFDGYKNVYQQWKLKDPKNARELSKEALKSMFIDALKELKYVGLL